MEERGVDRAQTILVTLMSHEGNLPATIATVKLLATLAAVVLLLGCGAAAQPQRPRADKFDSAAAWKLLREQVELGPRPAGSEQSLRLARRLRKLLPGGHFERVPGGLRNVVGTVRGREPGYIVVGAHYDTKDIPDFVGANDGAGGTAVVTQLARTIKRPRHTLKFILFDGEEAPRGVPDSQFVQRGLRGSKIAAKRYRHARAMVLLDFVADKQLSIPREGSSDPDLWRKLRSAARATGVGRHFPAQTQGSIQDDHLPFIEQGVPSIDLIDFDFPCWHRLCDDLTAVSERSVDASGEAVRRFLASL